MFILNGRLTMEALKVIEFLRTNNQPKTFRDRQDTMDDLTGRELRFPKQILQI